LISSPAFRRSAPATPLPHTETGARGVDERVGLLFGDVALNHGELHVRAYDRRL
jgi:hypothetical protein